MSITITCLCGVKLVVEEGQVDALGRCPGCGQPLNDRNDQAAPPENLVADAVGPEASVAVDTPPGPPAAESDSLASLAEPEPSTPRRPRARLYSPRAVAGAALVGGWLAGWLLLATNYRLLKRKAAAWLATLVGILGAAGSLVAVYLYADVPPRLGAVLYLGPLFLAQLAGAAVLLLGVAGFLQRRLFAEHLRAGGKQADGWDTLGPCLLASGIFFFVQAVSTYPITWQGSGGGITFGEGEEVYFTEGVSRAQGVRVGRKLQELGIFNGRGARTVVVSKLDDGFQVRVFLSEETFRNPGIHPLLDNRGRLRKPGLFDGQPMQAETRAVFDDLRRLLEREVFEGQPVEMVLCDPSNHPMEILR